MNKKNKFNDASAEALFKTFRRTIARIAEKNEIFSALEQEKKYAAYGIKLPFKIYYRYNLPENMEPLELLWTAEEMKFSAQIPDIKQLYIKLNETNDSGDSTYKEQLEFIESFSPEQIQQINKYISDNLPKYSEKTLIAEIKKLNPELAHIETKVSAICPIHPEIDFIRGVVWGFAPEDIEFVLSHTHEEMQQIAQDPRRQALHHGHFPAPSRLDAILAAEQQIQQIENARKNNGHE